MTYEQLGKIIEGMTEEQKQMDVTVAVDGEYWEGHLDEADEDDVLDEGHPFIFGGHGVEGLENVEHYLGQL
jgi:hypothetical protein